LIVTLVTVACEMCPDSVGLYEIVQRD